MTEHMLSAAQDSIREGLDGMESTLRSVRAEIADILGPEGSDIIAGSGKRLRSSLVLLCAALGTPPHEVERTLAAVVELIHLATLIHDDSIDDSLLRRGRPTAHVVWDHKIATMLGDLLYSRAFELLVGMGHQRLSHEIARATSIMSRGELEEFLMRGSVPTEETYLRIVWAKTAVLFGACCRVGAILGGLAPPEEERLARFGERMGMAFQVTDDILDYAATPAELGKDVGRDLRDGVVTLPLIAALSRAGDEKDAILAKVRQARDGQPVIGDIVEAVVRYGGIQHARSIAARLGAEARAMLEAFPPSPAIRSLDLIAQYAFTRKR